ncbi:MAG: DegT/DnrJ/EryC1/StrS family aminotransferase, partial [Acidobacteriota bacterium]
GLLVVEDAAQAMGAEYPAGKRAGGLGALGCISFYPTKNLGALGDAGMVVTNDPELADRIRILRTHGASPKYHHRWVGGNFRLDELQAAVLRVKLKYLDRWTSRRQELARRYEAFFGEADLLGESGARLPAAVYEKTGIARYHTYNQFVIRVSRRDALREHLQRRGIATEVYYPVPLHLQPCFRYLKYREGDFPVAEEAARETLALPVYPELGEAQQREIVTALREFYLM